MNEHSRGSVLRCLAEAEQALDQARATLHRARIALETAGLSDQGDHVAELAAVTRVLLRDLAASSLEAEEALASADDE